MALKNSKKFLKNLFPIGSKNPAEKDHPCRFSVKNYNSIFYNKPNFICTGCTPCAEDNT